MLSTEDNNVIDIYRRYNNVKCYLKKKIMPYAIDRRYQCHIISTEDNNVICYLKKITMSYAIYRR